MPKSPPLYCTRTADTGSGVQYNSGHEKNNSSTSFRQAAVTFCLPGEGGGRQLLLVLAKLPGPRLAHQASKLLTKPTRPGLARPDQTKLEFFEPSYNY